MYLEDLMPISFRLSRIATLVACLLLFAGMVSAGEKKLMHCFYFTVAEKATDADWQAFFKTTDDLPNKIPGLSRVWYGKLVRPLGVLTTADAETRKKLMAGETATGPITRLVRQYGVCMEMADEAALKAYADHPYHKDWETAYFKVRQPGTNSMDFMGK